MIKVKLKESYRQNYWDSSTGVTVPRGEIVEVDEDNFIVRHALDNGILQVVVSKQDELNIISDLPPNDTISEVFTADKIKSNREVVGRLKENAIAESTNKAN